MSRDDDDDEDVAGPAGTQRVDKWLWFVRVVKTRTLAAGLVHDGKVRVNRARIDKPSVTLKIGDVVTVSAGGRVRVLKVLAPGLRRGPPAEAQMLYEDLTPPNPAPKQGAADGNDPGGRPNKKERRDLARLRRPD